MKLSEELKWRGFYNQTTYQDISILDKEPITFYWGVDPSSDSMTIGNLASAMMVRCFIKHGHKVVLLVGGATGMIGDPDGKSNERNLKTIDEISNNKQAIIEQFHKLFSEFNYVIVDNYDWFKDFNYLNFLRDVGRYVPLNQMLGRDFVQKRLDSDGHGISYAEFSYALIQAYDFVHLSRKYGVSLQLCGGDQWGNSIAGVDLVRRLDSKEVHIYSTPLIINKSTGVKFGKSEGGAIWLSPDKTSIYKFYQFWLNVDDDGSIDYLKIYTDLSKEKIDEIKQKTEANPSMRIAQKTLAHEITSLVHGVDRAKSVERVTDVLFGKEDFTTLSNDDIDQLSKEIPVVNIGVSIIDALVQSGLSVSNSDAKRLIQNGALSINGIKISENIITKQSCLIKKGKNSFILVY